MNLFTLKGHIKYILFSLYNWILNKNRLRLLLKDEQKFNLTAMIRIKNEARFLPELIAYHIEIGVEHFFLYDNQSADNPGHILKPFIDSGYVTMIDWPIRPASPRCFLHFWNNYAHLSKWVAFIDADEYIVEPSDGFLKKHLSTIEVKTSALALNWRYFGSSGHDSIPSGLLIENFLQSNEDSNGHIKVIVQPNKVHSTYNSHNFVYFFPRLARRPNGSRVLGSHCTAGDVEFFRINHYVYRSRENFLSKSNLGYADAAGHVRNVRNAGRAEVEFTKHNDVCDDFIARNFGDRVRRRLTSFGYKAPYV
jgi:hypothetical protein